MPIRGANVAVEPIRGANTSLQEVLRRMDDALYYVFKVKKVCRGYGSGDKLTVRAMQNLKSFVLLFMYLHKVGISSEPIT